MEEYYQGNAIKKLKEELWNHVRIGADVEKYFFFHRSFSTVIFDSDAYFSFISTDFFTLTNSEPSVVNPDYKIKIASGLKEVTNMIVRGMDWLSKLRAKIVCFKKIVQILLSNRDNLEVHGELPEGNLKQLKTMKVNEPKLEDILVVREFHGVFPEYLSGKANVVADALSRKERLKPRRARAMSMTIHSSIKARILEAQSEASKDQPEIPEWKWEKLSMDLVTKFPRSSSGTLITNKAHATRYSVHPGADKMYYDLRGLYWWPRMKKDIAMYRLRLDLGVDRLTKSAHFLAVREDYKTEKLARLYINEIVARHGVPMSVISDRDSYFTSRFWQLLQKALGTRLDLSTTYHHETGGQSERTIQTLEDMLRACAIDFGGNLDTHLPLERRSTPRYVGPFEIVERVGPVAYRLRLPQDLVGIHDTFHVSNLKKCLVDVNMHVPIEEVKIDDKLHFIEEPMEIMDREVKKLKRNRIPIVKVRRNSRRGPEFAWEREDEMKRKYPQLFASATA
nr:retrotransposon protein, putative, Ty3-gypsy subclass [Tanacetum cinerariifolium]